MPIAAPPRVEAGAQWQDVTPPAAAHGLTALAGSAADVGVVGYTLGGGISWLARSHGLAANSVVAAQVVTADGVLRHVDEAHDPDLFWAIRGGGGGFGIVTALEFRLFPITEVFAGALFWPEASAPTDARARGASGPRRCRTRSPRSAASCASRRSPTCPSRCAAARSRSIEATMQEDAAEGARLLEGLRALGPEIDTFATIPTAALAGTAHGPAAAGAGLGHGALLRNVGGRRDRRRWSPPPRARRPRCSPSSCATSAEPSRPAPRPAARCRASTPTTRSSPWA